MAQSPYADLPPTAFWKTGVAAHNPLQIQGLWQPKFSITQSDKVVTAGSCFAQHFSRALVARGYNWTNAEPAPPLMRESDAPNFGYGVFSFRTGNIYTARMLRQWLQMAFEVVPGNVEHWEQDGRFYDPLRPAIEPEGFASVYELKEAREGTFAAIRKAIREADVFVFTMGLTECWRNRKTGLEYAICPGTIAGTYDPEIHLFANQRFAGITKEMRRCLELLKEQNPELKVLLTVSPVPLTATASGDHVLTATSASKSTLRAVARELVEDFDDVDYFPSYEIITHPAYRGMFYAPNQRSVVPEGVDHVMKNFFADQSRAFPSDRKNVKAAPEEAAPVQQLEVLKSAEDLRCEEEALNAFAR